MLRLSARGYRMPVRLGWCSKRTFSSLRLPASEALAGFPVIPISFPISAVRLRRCIKHCLLSVQGAKLGINIWKSIVTARRVSLDPALSLKNHGFGASPLLVKRLVYHLRSSCTGPLLALRQISGVFDSTGQRPLSRRLKISHPRPSPQKMQDVLRRRPLEKRHTKPCKYYQTMSCPLPADVCDFAHVPVNPSPAFTIDDTCRYYQAGCCANGAWCSYSHSIEVSPAVADTIRTSPARGQRMRSLSASGLRPLIPQTGVDQPPPIISTHMHVASVCNGPPSYSPLAPTHSPISSYASPPLVEPKLFLNASYLPPSPTAYTDVFDDLVVCTEDPHMNEHAHTHQSRVYITDTISPVHVPPYPTSPSHRHLSTSPMSPRFQIQSPLYTLGPKYVPVPIPLKKRRSRGVSKKKLEKYKTKPCRFFAMDGSCPNGDSCTFIHDEDFELLRKFTMKTTTFERDGCGPDSSESTSDSAPSDEEQVVRVGAVTTSQNIDQRDWRIDRANSRSPLFLPQLDTHLTRVPVSNGWARKTYSGRPRANSIPSTPSASSQMSVENLFSAECP